MTQTFYAGGFGISQPSFMGYVQDGKIYSTDATQGAQAIGVLSKTYDELKADYDSVYARCQQYYDRLVELGEIKPELTGDALLKAQAAELARATALINEMSEKQNHLLSVIQSMTATGQQPEEAKNEYSSDRTAASSGDLAAVARTDKRIEQSARPVSQHKGRSAARHS